MGKTFKKNEGRRPKWDKRGNKSHKQRDYEDDWKFARPPQYKLYPDVKQEPEFPEPPDFA